MDERPLNVVSLSRKEFDNQRVKPDNYLFFVYEEYVSEDGKAKTKISLYKGAIPVGMFESENETNNIIIDNTLNTTSKNPVENNVITKAINNKKDVPYVYPLDELYGLNEKYSRGKISGDLSYFPWKNGGREFIGDRHLSCPINLSEWRKEHPRFTIVIEALKYTDDNGSEYPTLFDTGYSHTQAGFSLKKSNGIWLFNLARDNKISIPDDDIPKDVWLKYVFWADYTNMQIGIRITRISDGTLINEQVTSIDVEALNDSSEDFISIGNDAFISKGYYFSGLIRNIIIDINDCHNAYSGGSNINTEYLLSHSSTKALQNGTITRTFDSMRHLPVAFWPLDDIYAGRNLASKVDLVGDFQYFPWKNGGREFKYENVTGHGRVNAIHNNIDIFSFGDYTEFTIIIEALKYSTGDTLDPILFNALNKFSFGKGDGAYGKSWICTVNDYKSWGIPDSELPKDVWLRYMIGFNLKEKRFYTKILRLEDKEVIIDYMGAIGSLNQIRNPNLSADFIISPFPTIWNGLIRNIAIYDADMYGKFCITDLWSDFINMQHTLNQQIQSSNQ